MFSKELRQEIIEALESKYRMLDKKPENFHQLSDKELSERQKLAEKELDQRFPKYDFLGMMSQVFRGQTATHRDESLDGKMTRQITIKIAEHQPNLTTPKKAKLH